MERTRRRLGFWFPALGLSGLLLIAGCELMPRPVTPATVPNAPGHLGAISDSVFRTQELNAEASDFVIYDHEFVGETYRLNTDGEDHVKQIAARLKTQGQFPVIVERTNSSTAPDDEFGYPVHPNPALDQRRREVIVKVLTAMNVPDAEQRVVVSTALAPSLDSHDIARAHRNIDVRQGFGSGGAGGFGGFGGFGLFF